MGLASRTCACPAPSPVFCPVNAVQSRLVSERPQCEHTVHTALCFWHQAGSRFHVVALAAQPYHV